MWYMFFVVWCQSVISSSPPRRTDTSQSTPESPQLARLSFHIRAENKQRGVTSQVQITLIQAHVARAGHDWVISQPVTLFITIINASASAPWEGSDWWMEKAQRCVCFDFSPPSWYHQDKLPRIWRKCIFMGSGSPLVSEVEKRCEEESGKCDILPR